MTSSKNSKKNTPAEDRDESIHDIITLLMDRGEQFTYKPLVEDPEFYAVIVGESLEFEVSHDGRFVQSEVGEDPWGIAD